MRKIALCLQFVNDYAYNIFSLSHRHQFDKFLNFCLHILHIQLSKRNCYTCLRYILHLTKDLGDQEVGPETLCLKLLVSFLVLDPVSQNFNFLVLF